jgi:hypothetical protein
MWPLPFAECAQSFGRNQLPCLSDYRDYREYKSPSGRLTSAQGILPMLKAAALIISLAQDAELLSKLDSGNRRYSRVARVA